MSSIKEIKILSALEKLYDCDRIPAAEYKGFSMLKNEKKSFIHWKKSQTGVIFPDYHCIKKITGFFSKKSKQNDLER